MSPFGVFLFFPVPSEISLVQDHFDFYVAFGRRRLFLLLFWLRMCWLSECLLNWLSRVAVLWAQVELVWFFIVLGLDFVQT